MEQIFQALPAIILRALPTFFLVILLHWYLKKVLVQPLDRVLEERRKRTAGSVESSQHLLAVAAEKTKQYQQSLADARAEIFREQEANRKRLADQYAAAVEAARAKTAERLERAKTEIDSEVQSARATLAGESDRIAEQIASSLLAGRAQ